MGVHNKLFQVKELEDKQEVHFLLQPRTTNMDLLSLLALIVICVPVIVVIFSFLYDADMTTIFCEKFGKDVSVELKGKVVWITGASTGIGAALAVEAVKKGAKVVISARREALLEGIKDKCIKQGADALDILVVPLDLCDYNSHQTCFEKILKEFGKLDILINNAGRSQRARWEHTDIQVDLDLFNLNVFSVVNLTRTVLPHMLENKSGTVAVMSSSAGKAGVPFSGTYTGSKHAVHGYFESLRSEKVGTGLDVCMLCPGPTFSDLLEVASTEKPGEKFGESMNTTDKRMTAERCAELSFIAIANKLPESWICFKPVLFLMYGNQYLPALSKIIMKILGPKFLANVRDSRNAMESDKYK